MQLSWAGANIVVLARSHNPTIISTEWVQRNHLVDEPAINFAHTPVLSMYQSATFQLLVEPERLQLALRVVSEANLQALGAGISNYATVLGHVPYRALGVNFQWQLSPERPGELDEILPSPEGDERRGFPPGTLRKGISLRLYRDDYLLRVLSVPPDRGEVLTVDFNFHFETSTPEAVRDAAARTPECFAVTRVVVGELWKHRPVTS